MYNFYTCKPSKDVGRVLDIKTVRMKDGQGVLGRKDKRLESQWQFSHGRECRDLDECGRNIHDCALNSKSGF